MSTLSDSLCVLVIILSREIYGSELYSILIQTFSQWFPSFIINDDLNTRMNSLSLLSYLIPHDTVIDYYELSDIPLEIEGYEEDFIQEEPDSLPIDEKMIQDAYEILTVLFNIYPQVSRKALKSPQDLEKAEQWITAIDLVLNIVSSKPFDPLQYHVTIINYLPPKSEVKIDPNQVLKKENTQNAENTQSTEVNQEKGNILNLRIIAEMFVKMNEIKPFSDIGLRFLTVIQKYGIVIGVNELLAPFEKIGKKIQFKMFSSLCSYLPLISKS